MTDKAMLQGFPMNLNDMIVVRLTPAGRAYHAAQHAFFNAKTGRNIPYTPIKEDAAGWSAWTLWEFMQEFGQQMYNGNPEPVCDMNAVLVRRK